MIHVYKARVAIGLNRYHGSPDDNTYYVPAETITEAIQILEEGRHSFFEGQPLQVISIELMEGEWLVPNKRKENAHV